MLKLLAKLTIPLLIILLSICGYYHNGYSIIIFILFPALLILNSFENKDKVGK